MLQMTLTNSCCLLIAVLLFSISAACAVTGDDLVGSYYRGDGTGYNVYVRLERSGSYTARWEGCLGTYGTARGAWSLRGSRITFRPTKETDMMKKHLRVLHIVTQNGGFALVPDLSDNYYRKYGADEYAAFHKQAANPR